MSDVKALQKERTDIFEAVYNNKIPKRVPVSLGLPFEPIAQFSGIDVVEAQWNPGIIEEAADKMCQTLYTDTCPFMGSFRYPSFYEVLKAQSFKMASTGFIQHPEVIGMLPEEYDYLIENPYDCILEKVFPRQYKALKMDEDPINSAIALTKGVLAYTGDMMVAGPIMGKLIAKYGYYPGGPAGSSGFTEAPCDFLADLLRSFKGISMDIRRNPEKVAAAADALYPIVFKKGLPANINRYSAVGIPLHMPPFMREKDFEKLWWPSFKRMLDEYASLGVHTRLFCESDWERFADYLADLPTDTVLMFEYGDPKKIKEKVGKKQIITGFYPMTMLKTHTKQQCIDKAKELIDILAPGGKYYFSLDKTPLMLSDTNMDNLCAVAEYVRDNAFYDNPGETAGMQFNKDDYKVDSSKNPGIKSKYYSTWEEYKAENPDVSDLGANNLQGLEERMFQFFIMMLM